MQTQVRARSSVWAVALGTCLALLLALPLPKASAKVSPAEKPELDFSLVGFAAVDALGQNGTTGGEGGAVVTVDTAEELLYHIRQPEPYVIRVAGHIVMPDDSKLDHENMYPVKSDKTIIGIGASAVISNGGFNIGAAGLKTPVSEPAPGDEIVHNIIIRNITFTDFPEDAVNIQTFSHHVWVDHCAFGPGGDGALDVKRGADYVTVSWNYFYNHDKTMLLGHDSKWGIQDTGRLKVTYHHNWFDGTVQRHPRVRFGEPVHVFNNYYRNIVQYAIGSQCNAGVLVEGNYFENVAAPMLNNIEAATGRILARNNVFVNSLEPIFTDSVTEPSTYYNYVLDDPQDVPAIVMAGAGINKIAPYGVGLRLGASK